MLLTQHRTSSPLIIAFSRQRWCPCFVRAYIFRRSIRSYEIFTDPLSCANIAVLSSIHMSITKEIAINPFMSISTFNPNSLPTRILPVRLFPDLLPVTRTCCTPQRQLKIILLTRINIRFHRWLSNTNHIRPPCPTLQVTYIRDQSMLDTFRTVPTCPQSRVTGDCPSYPRRISTMLTPVDQPPCHLETSLYLCPTGRG